MKGIRRESTPSARRAHKSGMAARGSGHRDRQETRKRILTSLGHLLARKGSRGLGINAIAREAKVDKVLIYRYFGGLNQLYRAFALEGNTFPSLQEIAEGRLQELSKLSPADGAKAMILGFGRAIRRRPITKEIMRWDLQERNGLTEALARERERRSQEWLALAPDLPGVDLAAVSSVLVAGQVFLALRAKTTDTYNGIDLHSESGWKRIEDAVGLLTDLFFQNATPGRNKRRPASRREVQR